MIIMKKKIILFVVLFLIPLVVNASSISLSCDSTVVKGTSLKCTLKGKSNNLVTAVSAKIKTGSNISFSSFKPSSVWQGDGEKGAIDLYTASDIDGTFVIGTVNFNVTPIEEGGNTTITIDSIYFYDENGVESSVNSVTKKIRIASSNNDLSSLSLSSGTLIPKFSSNVTSYSTTIDANSVKISVSAKNNYSTVSGDVGKVNLKYGNNTFKVVVTSESGKTKTYTINIVRPNSGTDEKEDNKNGQSNNAVTKSSNTNLKSIILSNGSINFDKKVTNYNINVANDIVKIDVIATPEDKKSKVEISGNDNLVVGNNEIKIKVIAEDNSSKTYVINVERKETTTILSSNNYISNIIIKGHNINFNKDTLNYVLKIKSEKKLDIEVLLEDSTANYNIKGNAELEDGSVIEIVVTAEDGSIRIYNVNIESNDKNIKAVFIIMIIILLVINLVRLFLKYRREKKEAANQ